MKYYYEYKYKNGNTVGGSNLETIDFLDKNIFPNHIRLLGVDILQTNYGFKEQHWATLLDMNEIEYLKIEPMLEEGND